MRSACLGAGRVGGKGDGREATKEEAGTGDQIGGMKSEARSLFVGCFVCQLRNALIGSHSPVSRSSSSSNYTSFFPFGFVWLRFSLLVLARLCY